MLVWDTLGPDLQDAEHPHASLWSTGAPNSLQHSPFSLLVCVSLPQIPFGTGAFNLFEGQEMKKDYEAEKSESLPSKMPRFSNLVFL